MASSTKRSWKLQDFVAHTSNVNCLALGHKTGRVLVTGGDDKKVNLWAVGKQNCFMSLSGHTTPVECVRFSRSEDLVCAGSQMGALKIWDLEQARLTRTLIGHKAEIRCMDFHPYGQFLTSGSLDTSIKLWDIRKKGCIFTYKGHDRSVNSLKFSPDGHWIASAGDEGMVKLWDLKMGRQLSEFSEHQGPATTVAFHPYEFLLATGSSDRTVHFWDLESFQLVSSTEPNQSTAIRCLYFSQGGECLFAGSQDVLRVYGWEPSRALDTVPTGWGKVQDIAIVQNQLIGASFHAGNVVVYVCDLKKIAPFGGVSTSGTSFNHGNSLRKSFSKERPSGLKKHTYLGGPALQGYAGMPGMATSPKNIPRCFLSTSLFASMARHLLWMHVKTIEEADKSSTDPEDEATFAEIPNVAEYTNVFQPNRSLSRTPPPEIAAFPEPLDIDPAQPQVIQNLSESMGSLNTGDGPEYGDAGGEPAAPVSQAPTLSLTKPVPVRVHPIKSSPPVQRNAITSTSQIRANLQANNALGRNMRNLAQIPPLRQSITPFPGKKSNASNQQQQPAGPQRSNSTLSPRVAPMASVSLVINDGKLMSRAPSPDSPKIFLKRQSSCREGEKEYESDFPVQINNSIRHSPSDPQLNRPNTGQTRTSNVYRNFVGNAPLSARIVSTPKKPSKAQVAPHQKVETRVPQVRPVVEETDKPELVPMSADKPYGLDADTFLPNKYGQTSGYTQMGVFGEMSEAEVISSMMRGHESMMAVLTSRQRSLQIIYSLWHNKDLKSAIDSAVAMNDLSVIVDLLGVLTLKPTMWNLDLCNSLLTPIGELLQSKYEMYVTVGIAALRLILRNFAPVIKSNVEAPIQTIGVDVSREERYHKCFSCYDKLSSLRPLVQKKQAIPGKLGASFRELGILIGTLE